MYKLLNGEAGVQGPLIFEGLSFHFYWLLCLGIAISWKHFFVETHLTADLIIKSVIGGMLG